MSDKELERRIRQVVVEELTLLAKAVWGQQSANSYAIASFRAEQERETTT